MRIIVFKIPMTKTDKGMVLHEDKKELMPEKEEKVKESDMMKLVSQVAKFNADELSMSEQIEGEYVLRKIIVE